MTEGMPSSLFDPRWRDPQVATHVAFVLFCRSGVEDAAADAATGAAGALGPLPAAVRPELADARGFAFAHVHSLDDGLAERFKGGSFGELHRHYAFGKYTVNFHAQAVAFGFDDVGRWFLTSTVGRFDGPWGNDAMLVVSYFAGAEHIGSCTWQRSLDPVADVRVRLIGRDAKLAARFDDVDRAEVSFVARHGRDVPMAEGPAAKLPARLSRARRSVVARELARLLAMIPGDERDAALRKLLGGVASDDARELLDEAQAGLGAHIDIDKVLRLVQETA